MTTIAKKSLKIDNIITLWFVQRWYKFTKTTGLYTVYTRLYRVLEVTLIWLRPRTFLQKLLAVTI